MADDMMAVNTLEDGELPGVLHRARQALGCDEAGLIHVRGGWPISAAHTSEVAGALDRAQCDVGEGPSLDAIRQLQAMSVADVGDLTWWPVFRRTALDGGVKSCLAVPLTVGSDVVGALAFYSIRANALTGCEELAIHIADKAGAAMTGESPHRTI
jgi:transcriptional regulator with GAF, ATPase, and Fis domain